jgi:hypothetical protein
MNSKLIGIENVRQSRREWIASSIAIASSLVWSSATQAIMDSKRKPNDALTGLFRVRAVLEIAGEIRLKSQTNDATAKGGKMIAAKTAPIKANSTVDFDEQYEIGNQLTGCKSYQHYHESGSEIQIDRHITKTSLREQCNDILRVGSDQGLIATCPNSPLFAAERDLIEGPINTMFIDQLLTDKEVQIADKWIIDNTIACRLLNMDAIQAGKLVMCLVGADDAKAQLELDGTLSASVRQVPTTLKIEGKAQLDRKTSTISWFAVKITETREISEAEPGFQITAQLRILRSPIEAMSTGETLKTVSAKMGTMESASLFQFQSDLGYYRFVANRKWSTYRDSGEEATLRYVVNNRVVAQCNITNMIDYEPGRQLSLEGFQADVKTALGKALIEVVEASERLSVNKLRLLRIVSRGETQGVDIQWIHYHISNDDGRRVVLAFTLNEANMELFAAEDAQLADSFELINWPTKLDAKAVEALSNETPASDGKKNLISQPNKATDPTVSGRPKLAR